MGFKTNLMHKYKYLLAAILLLSLELGAQVPDSTGTNPPTTTKSPGKEVIFERVEQEASFPGGDKAWIKFLRENLDPEVPVRRKAKGGQYTVVVQFIVGKDGKLSDIKALSQNGFGMEEEVIRVIKLSPDWEPARQNNRIVKAYRRQPITFFVEEEKPAKRKKKDNSR